VFGQPYPIKPVKIIVGFPPGGGNDFIARFIAQRLTSALGQQVIVENKPGASGTIGQTAGVLSPPDGYTLTLISSSYTIAPSLYKLPRWAYNPSSTNIDRGRGTKSWWSKHPIAAGGTSLALVPRLPALATNRYLCIAARLILSIPP